MFLVLVVLKKNYAKLCRCLPQDYMTTINKLSKLTAIIGGSGALTDVPVADFVNERIVASLMTGIQSDLHALPFCDIMEKVVDDKSMTYIETFRNGA